MTNRISRVDQMIENTRQQLDELYALRADMAGEAETGLPADDDFADANLMELPLAAHRFGIAKDKLRRWCRDDGIGVLHGGRWWVSTPRLRRHLGQAGK